MKKKAVYRSLSVFMLAEAVFGIVCAVTAKGGGFLDLSNIIRGFSIGAAVLCIVLAWVFYKKSK